MSFNVKFIINGNLEVNESASDNLMFAELIYKFSQKVGLKEEHKAAFIFNSDKIKADSIRTLKDIGIEENSVINVKTKRPLDYKPKNIENSKNLQNNYIDMGMNMNHYGNMYMNQNMNNYGNMNMNQNMSSGFFIMFSLNGVYAGSMYVTENMLFSEVVSHFSKYYPIRYENEVIFFYNLNPIKSDSNKKLKELGIKNMSIIDIKTKAPINDLFNYNYGNMGMNHYPFIGLQNYENMNEKIKIVFNYKIDFEANKDTKFSDLSKRFCSEVDLLLKAHTYYLGSQKIKSTENQTLSQLNIYNNSEISVLTEDKDILNVFFFFEGKTINVQATKNTKFSELSEKFCLLADISDKHPKFLINSFPVHSTDNRTLAELNISNQSKIDVVFEGEIIGG